MWHRDSSTEQIHCCSRVRAHLCAAANGVTVPGVRQEDAASEGGHVWPHGHGEAQDNVQALHNILRELLCAARPK